MAHALVTGTSSGLGLLAAEGLVERDWTVTGAMRNPSRAAGETRWETIELDLTDQATIDAVAAHIGERHGRLDALVSNAGTYFGGPWEEMTSEELRGHLEVNLVGTMALVRACLPWLRVAGGAIVQVTSISGRIGEALSGAYNAGKFGLEGASEALAKELAPLGVRVVLVEPGPFRTTIVDTSLEVAARGATGLYDQEWLEGDEWADWFRTESEDPQIAADAIVAASVSPDAPFRIPVGIDAGREVREHAEDVIADVERAEAFLRAFRDG